MKFSKFPFWLQGCVLLALSVALELSLDHFHLPAAFLLGPMAAAIVAAVMQTRLKVPDRLFQGGQAIVGCLIAQSITTSILRTIAVDWPVFIGGVLSVIIVSNGLGWVLAKLRVLPGKTAIWGSSPGGATAMVLMSEAFGADMRLVAFMQYLRVIFVAAVATIVARLFVGNEGPAAAIIWFPAMHWIPFAETMALALFGVLAAPISRIPAASLLIPMIFAAILHGLGLMVIELPPWLLAISYALVGWSIGLRFNRQILAYAARAFPRVALAILCLIALCGGLAALIHIVMHVDPLTAYLATSPGGLDSVAIISASSPNVNVPFIIAMQTARFLLVLFVGAPVARFICTKLL